MYIWRTLFRICNVFFSCGVKQRGQICFKFWWHFYIRSSNVLIFILPHHSRNQSATISVGIVVNLAFSRWHESQSRKRFFRCLISSIVYLNSDGSFHSVIDGLYFGRDYLVRFDINTLLWGCVCVVKGTIIFYHYLLNLCPISGGSTIVAVIIGSKRRTTSFARRLSKIDFTFWRYAKSRSDDHQRSEKSNTCRDVSSLVNIPLSFHTSP